MPSLPAPSIAIVRSIRSPPQHRRDLVREQSEARVDQLAGKAADLDLADVAVDTEDFARRRILSMTSCGLPTMSPLSTHCSNTSRGIPLAD